MTYETVTSFAVHNYTEGHTLPTPEVREVQLEPGTYIVDGLSASVTLDFAGVGDLEPLDPVVVHQGTSAQVSARNKLVVLSGGKCTINLPEGKGAVSIWREVA